MTNPTDEFKFTVMKRTSYELYARKKPRMYEFVKEWMVPNDIVGVQKILSG
jgi:hypothetical protein